MRSRPARSLAVALSLLLLICAVLFARSLGRAQRMDPGFSLRNGFLASVDLLPNGYDEPRGLMFFQQLLERVGGLPGIESVALATAMPLDIGSGSDMGVQVHGYQPRLGEELNAKYQPGRSALFRHHGHSHRRGTRH